MPISQAKLVFTPTVAGVWNYVDASHVTSSNNGNLANSFFGNVKLGPEQREGIILTGWQYSGFSNTAGDVTPVNLGVLAQQDDGTLLMATQDYVSSTVTNGGGSVLVADFNGDGRDDVFLAAHNESPFVSKASLVLLSNNAGGFDRLTLDDRIMAHDAQLTTIGGKPTVLTASFHNDRPGGGHPIYTWNGADNFSFYEGAKQTTASFMSVAVADLNGDGVNEMILGDLLMGPGYAYNQSNKFKIGIYDFSTGDLGAAPLRVITPYFEARPEYANVASTWGLANTHSYRVWIEDFNHDGRPDIVAGQSLWDPSHNTWPSVLQLLQNQGNLQFADVTDTLNTMSRSVDELDYSMQMIDLDGSGIKSWLSASRSYHADSRQANYLLVNDGTGKLHVALHDEFVTMGQQVTLHASTLYNNPSTLYVHPTGQVPKFQGYLTADGLLNYVAEVSGYQQVNGFNATISSVMVNVPLGIDITRDFTTAIEITDRNGSKLMRTFAGNDTIHQTNAATSAKIDGGLGIDTAVYLGNKADHTLSLSGDGFRVAKTNLTDTLVNIERLVFADTKVAIDIDGNAGQVAKLLGAIAGRDAVLNKAYVGIGLTLMDGGISYDALMQLAINEVLGPDASNAAVVTLIYTNLAGVAPDATALALYQGMLDSGELTQSQLGVLAAEEGINLANINLIGLANTGLDYL